MVLTPVACKIWMYQIRTVNSTTMDIFETVKNHTKIMGFQRFNHPQSQWLCLVLKALPIAAYLLACAPITWCLVFDSETFIEQARAFAIFNMVAHSSVNYCILLWRWDQMEQNIESLTLMIQARSSTSEMLFICASKVFFFTFS